jgi:hypothetical protein
MSTMTHDEIEAAGIVDRFVAGTLDTATSDAFEEHFFGCDECFARVQSLEALRSAVRHAAVRGELSAPIQPVRRAETTTASRPSAMSWLPMAASLVLAAGLGWMALVEIPSLRGELESSRNDRDQLRAALDNVPKSPAVSAPAIEANLAMVTLSAERGITPATTVTLDPTASQFVVIIDAPASPSGNGRLEITSNSSGASVASVGGLIPGANGLWSVSLPASSFPDGTYRVRLRADSAGGGLLGEYVLTVSRRPR